MEDRDTRKTIAQRIGFALPEARRIGVTARSQSIGVFTKEVNPFAHGASGRRKGRVGREPFRGKPLKCPLKGI
jgi:hypothetical protein